MSKLWRIIRLAAAATALVPLLAVGGAGTAFAQAGQTTSAPSDRLADRATRLLFEAVHTNDFAGAEAAVAAGASVEARDRWNITPIELAIDKGYFRIAHFLVSVRNSRQPSGDDSPRAATPVETVTPRSVDVSNRAVPAAPAASPDPVAVWPTDQPNPFDPDAPAFGAGLPVVSHSETRSAPESGHLETGPLLATDAFGRSGKVGAR
jgi:hypothetical protein